MTPLFSAMENYAGKNPARFHMPGHKGRLAFLGDAARYDLTECDGCDELYRPSSVIAEIEALYSRLYGSAASLLSAGGSTLCIQTMLALAAASGGSIICGRGVHVSAINAMALLGIEPLWIFPETDMDSGIVKAVTKAQIRDALMKNPGALAVYITSPGYMGLICDIEAISAVCHEFGKPLLVDNAHGAHLRFLEPSLHPIGLGADMCCDSLHKTMPVLTGGAMLHIGNDRFIPDAKRYMSVFGSTSPSYLIMASADIALNALQTDFKGRLRHTAERVGQLEEAFRKRGFFIPCDKRDPLKITVGFNAAGYGDAEFLELLRSYGIEPEMASGGFCVFMASPSNIESDFSRLCGFIAEIPVKSAGGWLPYERIKPVAVKSLREAVFAPSYEILLREAVGKIAGLAVAPCPPGIPVVVPGELIDEKMALCLKNYGVSRLNVLK